MVNMVLEIMVYLAKEELKHIMTLSLIQLIIHRRFELEGIRIKEIAIST